MSADRPTVDPNRVVQHVQAHVASRLAMMGAATSCVVALSGGLDSSVLLHALARGPRRGELGIRAIHVNHGLQAAASEFAARAEALASSLCVPCVVIQVNIPPSDQGVEGEARIQRYRALAAALQPGEWLLTAHHDDDQAETILARLARAAGGSALRGIAPVRSFGAGHLARPLLGLGRAELLAYAETCGLQWCEDPMNRALDLERSFLRHQVLPLLQTRWPDYAAQAARSVALLQPSLALAEQATLRQLASVQDADPSVLNLDALLQHGDADVLAMVRMWLAQLGLERPGARWLAELLRQLREGAEALHLVTQQVQVRQYRRRLFASRTGPAEPRTLSDDQEWDGREPLPWSDGREYVLSAPLREPLQVRFRRGGERIRLSDQGRSQEVRDLFQRHGLPPWNRDLPFLFVAGNLLAVGDLWQSEAFRRHLGTVRLRSHPLESMD
ncbi:tRNA lysidine(34) synthetase TilS [Ahniella affigens]|uniref:tRNA(Ile)-lysidine synthase n=1 Tax=Ahniella affigens TaxID=2021234 RepID=A0A2P1PTW5_9GAMM|nr:tRNA lysidine(34) synthetase TilS [Ahniella affigens]AVP98283.1 tRNA lysidine(34) synthetase TilS [Ahniella affigens]